MQVSISVIIPTYNIERYILKCLDSLGKQTISKQFFEVIVIDDASTDRTVQMVKNYKNIENLKIIELSENKGPGIARNKGVKKAVGKYLLFLDGDDQLEIDALEIINKNILDEPDCVVYNWAYSDDPKKTPRKRDFQYISTEKENFVKDYLGMNLSGDVIYTTVKKEIFEANNLSFSEGFHEDIAVIFKIFYLSLTIKKLTHKVLYLKHKREDSIVSTITFKHVDGYLSSWPDIMRFILEKENELPEKYLKYYLRGINGLLYTLIIKILGSDGDITTRKKLYEYIFVVLQRDEFINVKNLKDFPKITLKDCIAYEYMMLMLELKNKLNNEIILYFEKRILQKMKKEEEL